MQNICENNLKNVGVKKSIKKLKNVCTKKSVKKN